MLCLLYHYKKHFKSHFLGRNLTDSNEEMHPSITAGILQLVVFIDKICACLLFGSGDQHGDGQAVENRNRTSTFSSVFLKLETLALLCKQQHFLLLVLSQKSWLYKEYILISGLIKKEKKALLLDLYTPAEKCNKKEIHAFKGPFLVYTMRSPSPLQRL